MRALEGFAWSFPIAWLERRTALPRDQRKHRNQSGVRPSLVVRSSEGSAPHRRSFRGTALARLTATTRAPNQF